MVRCIATAKTLRCLALDNAQVLVASDGDHILTQTLESDHENCFALNMADATVTNKQPASVVRSSPADIEDLLGNTGLDGTAANEEEGNLCSPFWAGTNCGKAGMDVNP